MDELNSLFKQQTQVSQLIGLDQANLLIANANLKMAQEKIAEFEANIQKNQKTSDEISEKITKIIEKISSDQTEKPVPEEKETEKETKTKVEVTELKKKLQQIEDSIQKNQSPKNDSISIPTQKSKTKSFAEILAEQTKEAEKQGTPVVYTRTVYKDVPSTSKKPCNFTRNREAPKCGKPVTSDNPNITFCHECLQKRIDLVCVECGTSISKIDNDYNQIQKSKNEFLCHNCS